MVSILQMMGFSKTKADETPAKETPAKRGEATSARRQDVKAQSGKNTEAKAAPAKPAPVSKTAPKPTSKVAAPAAPKATKPPAKAAAKSVSQPAAKPAVKVAVKPAQKDVAKSVGKAPIKAAVKVPAKAPVAIKPVKSATPAAQPAGKTVAKATPKSVAKSPIPVSAPAKPAAKAKAASSAPAVVVKEKKSMSANPTPAKSTPAPAATPAPAKAGRPSSRLAQLTVPSIAQSVASTAAKASYSQEETLPAIIPVLPATMKKDVKLVNSWKTKPVAELTDADLIAMPDAEYMNDVQLAVFRLKLVVLKTDILNNAGETTEHLREDSAVVPDPADRATIEEEHALELRTRDRERKLLKKIEQSITRIDAGDYGYCDETGEAIGVGRLLARPTATLSLEAQQRRELKQKMFGD
jgi:DnaK suppressor protein